MERYQYEYTFILSDCHFDYHFGLSFDCDFKPGAAPYQQYNASVPLTVFFHTTQKLKRVVKQLENAANEAESAAAIEVLHHIQAGMSQPLSLSSKLALASNTIRMLPEKQPLSLNLIRASLPQTLLVACLLSR